MKGWSKRSIGDIAKVTSSKRIFLSDYVGFGVPFWRSKEVIEQFNGKDVSTELFIAQERYNEIKAKFGVPTKGDILLTSVGTVGVPHLVRNDSPFYFKDGNLTWVKDIIAEVEPYYIYLWLSSNVGQKEIQNNLIGSSQKALTIDSLKKIKIFLPPLPTQKKIAGILSAYDDAIENNLRRIKLLEEMAQITYEEWFVRLRFPGHTTTPINKATGLPEGWRYGSLGDLVEFQNGYAFKGGDFKNEGFPVIKIKNIGGNTVDIKDTDFVDSEVANVASKFKLDEGDLLIAMTGATIGKTGFLPFSSKPCYLNQRVGKFLRKKDGNNIHYIFAAIGGDRGLQQVLGLASGAAQPNISGNQILSLKCTVPSREILSKYSSLMQSNFGLILGFVRQNQRFREARDILLPRLMTGVIDAEKYQPENFLNKN